jgi:hypothetical protein
VKKQFLLIIIFSLLNSCGKSVDVQEDKYPNIPEFPKFENDVLKLHKIQDINFEIDSTFGYIETRYLVKDSTLAIINFTTTAEDRLSPQKNDLYMVNLSVIKNKKCTSSKIIDTDFKLNFQIDSTDNITIGKHKYLANSDYFQSDSIPNLRKEDWIDPSKTFEYQDKIFYKPELFEKIAVKSETEITGVQNSPIIGFKNVPIFMNYYKVKHHNKVGLTKVYGGFLPEIVTAKNQMYYIKQTSNSKNKKLGLTIYKIE